MRLRSMRRRATIGAAVTAALAAAVPTATLAADNLAPSIAVPGTQAIDEDTALTFSTGAGNAISVADADAGSATVRTTVAGNFGHVSLAGTSGLSFSAGDGSDDGTMTFDGTLASANAALDGMRFTPDANFYGLEGTATVTVTVDDLGNTGDGGPQSDSDMVTVQVNGVNDAPVNHVPAGLGTYADLPKTTSSADLNAFSIGENDGGDTQLEVTLAVSDGTLTLGGTAGLTVTDGANGSAAMTVQGTLGNINAALDGLTYTPSAGFTGQATVGVVTDDLGNTGAGGPLSDSDVTTIRVDAPEDTVYWTASKDTPLSLPGALGRAELDGGGGANLLTGPELSDTPSGVAIDVVEGRIYWANTGAFPPTRAGIWSAKLDGTDKQLFVDRSAPPAGAPLSSAFGLAIDQETRRLYWANTDNVTPANRGIGWASLEDPATGGRVDTGAAGVGSPRGLALDLESDRVYWTNSSISPSIAFAPLPGASGLAGTFTVTGTSAVSQPSGIAVDLDGGRLLWANGSGGTVTERLKVATLPTPFASTIDASHLDVSPLAGGAFRAPAIDATAERVYWANVSTDRISSANLDGTGGGAELPTGTAFTNSADGVTILRRPEPVGPPAISGTAEVGATLTCAPGAWAPDQPNAGLYRMPASTRFEWTRDGGIVPGATGSAYTPDAAGEHRCVHRASNFAGASVQESAPVVVVATSVPAPAPPPSVVPDTIVHPRPDTILDARPKKTIKTRKKSVNVTFRFSATVGDASFKCKIDRAPFKPCVSPKRYRVKTGRHRFTVVAVSLGGTDSSPAAFGFRVKRFLTDR